MTPDDLRALREVLDCGSHDGMAKSAVWHAAFGECDECLTLLLNAALAQRVEGMEDHELVALADDLNDIRRTKEWPVDDLRETLLAALTGGAK